MKTSAFTTAAALLSTSYAATVTLETTACLEPTYPSGQPLEIEMNLSSPVAVGMSQIPKRPPPPHHQMLKPLLDLPTVCGLRIVSASPGVDINTIKCQAFKDVAGTTPGSAVFTYASPALIATNPVQEKAIKCTYSVAKAHERRQFNETMSPSLAASTTASSALGSTALPVSSEASAASSEQPSTVTSMVVVTPSAGMPSPSGNSTTSVLSTRATPSQSAQPSNTPGAASEVGVGMGVAFAAVLAMLV
jgi:hypothetical protein